MLQARSQLDHFKATQLHNSNINSVEFVARYTEIKLLLLLSSVFNSVGMMRNGYDSRRSIDSNCAHCIKWYRLQALAH